MKGFVSPLLIAGIAAGLLAVGIAIQTKRLESAKAELALCADRYKQALASIQKQNEAVETWQKSLKEAKERAQAASQRAGKASAASKVERERLVALLANQPKPDGLCPAGTAVKELRSGLK